MIKMFQRPDEASRSHRVLPESVKAEYRPNQPVFCEACGHRSKKLLFLDHNHATGQVRKWVCYNCNSALGFAKEDPRTLRKLADYVEEHNGNLGPHINETTQRFRETARGMLGNRKECEECGEEFHFVRSTARFCSDRCKKRSQRRSAEILGLSGTENCEIVGGVLQVPEGGSPHPTPAPSSPLPFIEIRQAPSLWVRKEWSAICDGYAVVSDCRASWLLAWKLISAGFDPERPVRVLTRGWPARDYPSLGSMAARVWDAPPRSMFSDPGWVRAIKAAAPEFLPLAAE